VNTKNTAEFLISLF